MVEIIFDDHFQRAIQKIKDQEIQKIIKNKIQKIIENPEVGKPMRNVRKGTREVYFGAGSFRLSYEYQKHDARPHPEGLPFGQIRLRQSGVWQRRSCHQKPLVSDCRREQQFSRFGPQKFPISDGAQERNVLDVLGERPQLKSWGFRRSPT